MLRAYYQPALDFLLMLSLLFMGAQQGKKWTTTGSDRVIAFVKAEQTISSA